MRWLLLFGGIAVFGLVWLGSLGWWLWRKFTALLAALAEAQRKLASAAAGRQDVGSNGHPARDGAARSQPPRRPAGAGQRR